MYWMRSKPVRVECKQAEGEERARLHRASWARIEYLLVYHKNRKQMKSFKLRDVRIWSATVKGLLWLIYGRWTGSQRESVKGQVGITRPKQDMMIGWIWVAAEMKRRQILEDKINKIWWMIRYEGKKRCQWDAGFLKFIYLYTRNAE